MKAGRSGQKERGRYNNIREVDLHLRSGYNSPDALSRQLNRFRSEMDSALRDGCREIVFIHGAGEGKLREELRKVILTDYKSCRYEDASFSSYGYGGATLVHIR